MGASPSRGWPPLAPRGGEPVTSDPLAVELAGRAMERLKNDELDRLEKHVGFLATVGSVSPFIGLMGTVWGVMSAFMNIGVQGSASLIVVAPGIAEALIATVAGLAAAIPAVVGSTSSSPACARSATTRPASCPSSAIARCGSSARPRGRGTHRAALSEVRR